MSHEKNWMFHTAPLRMILNIENGDYPSHLNRKLRLLNQEITMAHLIKVIHQFKKSGIITVATEGRCIICNLTTKGEEVQNHLRKILEVLNNERKEI